jgi:16S rRNA (cytosine967-C5)-methyltransferase
MNDPQSKSARTVAVTVLDKADPKKTYISQSLESILKTTLEKQKTTDLVFGTIRNRSAIDLVIEKFAGCPVDRIHKKLINIIRVAVYELIYCPETVEYAIVNETVETAKIKSRKKQLSFINAVLRQLCRSIENRNADLKSSPPGKILPQSAEYGCLFKNEFLPDCQKHPAQYLSFTFSLPQWLIEQWLKQFGFEKTKQICIAGNRRPSVYIRPNPLKTTPEKLLELFSENKITADITDESMIQIKSPHSITGLPGFKEGLFTVQDPAAAKPVRALNPQQNWRILDLCAAPGTKTTQIAELTNGQAEIIATDIDKNRLLLLTENIKRLGLQNISMLDYDKIEKQTEKIGQFDCILLDVPCSNSAVLAKRAEVRYRINQNAVENLAKIQKNLLILASNLLKPGGKICYSTCSIIESENEKIIDEFLKTNPNFCCDQQQTTLPNASNFDHDGGFYAVLTSN